MLIDTCGYYSPQSITTSIFARIIAKRSQDMRQVFLLPDAPTANLTLLAQRSPF
ncbi:MAG: hypothetical protein M1G31_09985 [Pseudanabaena sp. Salubria-1]|nr:hypothetical protein [Pseudanabaena sp. Salubria-1]